MIIKIFKGKSMVKRKDFVKLALDLGYVLMGQDGSHMVFSHEKLPKLSIINHQNTSNELSPGVIESIYDHFMLSIFVEASEEHNFALNEEVRKAMEKRIRKVKEPEMRQSLEKMQKTLFKDAKLGIYKFLSKKAKLEIKEGERNHEGAVKYIQKMSNKNKGGK